MSDQQCWVDCYELPRCRGRVYRLLGPGVYMCDGAKDTLPRFRSIAVAGSAVVTLTLGEPGQRHRLEPGAVIEDLQLLEGELKSISVLTAKTSRRDSPRPQDDHSEKPERDPDADPDSMPLARLRAA